MKKCSPILRQIRMATTAMVVLFMLGGMVLGSSFMWFDNKLKTPVLPRSLVESHHASPLDSSNVWYVMLLICASVGLPLGMYVFLTLHNCQDALDKQNSSS